MDADGPTHSLDAAGGTVPESAEARHTRELERSVGELGDTVEHAIVRMLKIAVPIVLGVFAAMIGAYVLGNRLRDRAEARRIARATRRARPRLIVVDPPANVDIPAGAYVAEATA
jgi:hypothetical protein